MILTPMRRLLVATSLLLLAGCAAAAGPAASGTQPARAEAVAGRECRIATHPSTLPDPAELVHAPALRRDLLDLWRGAGGKAGYAVVSVAYDQNGWNARRTLLDHDLRPDVADSVQALIFHHRRAVAPGAPWGVRLRVEVDHEVRYRVDRQELCAARAVDLDFLEANPTVAWARALRPLTDLAPGTVWVRVLVDRHGTVAAAQVERSTESIRSLTPVLNRLQMVTFQPALVDGAPVESWIRLALPVR